MSILDYIENPAYQTIAVCFSKTDAVIVIGPNPKKAVQGIDRAIELLLEEKDRLLAEAQKNTKAVVMKAKVEPPFKPA